MARISPTLAKWPTWCLTPGGTLRTPLMEMQTLGWNPNFFTKHSNWNFGQRATDKILKWSNFNWTKHTAHEQIKFWLRLWLGPMLFHYFGPPLRVFCHLGHFKGSRRGLCMSLIHFLSNGPFNLFEFKSILVLVHYLKLDQLPSDQNLLH